MVQIVGGRIHVKYWDSKLELGEGRNIGNPLVFCEFDGCDNKQ